MIIFASFMAFIALHFAHGLIFGALHHHESPFTAGFWSAYDLNERAARAAAREIKRSV